MDECHECDYLYKCYSEIRRLPGKYLRHQAGMGSTEKSNLFGKSISKNSNSVREI